MILDRIQAIKYLFRATRKPENKRYEYQKQFISHNFTKGEKILDIGSGGDPFPYATILADRYITSTHHRSAPFESEDKPVVICDICNLPFTDGAFDYVTSSHVLEHVDNPIMACLELQRVAKAGFIETPTLMKDALFSWARGQHKWHILNQGNCMIFLEYSDRQLDGIKSSAWNDLIFSTVYHPLQDAFNDNQEIFNVFFEWENQFNVIVIRKDGSVMSSNKKIDI